MGFRDVKELSTESFEFLRYRRVQIFCGDCYTIPELGRQVSPVHTVAEVAHEVWAGSHLSEYSISISAGGSDLGCGLLEFGKTGGCPRVRRF